MEHKHIIEINGVKLEVDLRNATVIDNLSIGDTVKVLEKQYSNYASWPGVIVGFDNFKNLPTIMIAAMKKGYSSTDIVLHYYNAESTDLEIIKANENDFEFDKCSVIESLNREIYRKKQEIIDIENKKSYFLVHFKKYFLDFKKNGDK